MKKALTAAGLSALKPTGKAYYVSDKQDGLRVRVAPSGALTWVVTFRIKGQGVNSVSLGLADPSGRNGKSLAEARDRAAAMLKAARSGENLVAQERAKERADDEATTMSELITQYAKHISSAHRRGGPLRTAGEIERRLRRALATKLSAVPDKIHRGDLSKLLDKVAERYPREAEKRRQVLHAMFKWATAKGYASANPLSGSPSYGAGEPRDRALSAEEIGNLWKWLDAGADNMSPDAISVLRLQLLLGARAGELAGIEAQEVDTTRQTWLWTLPAERSKNKKPRVTPLVGRARDLVTIALRSRPTGALYRTLDASRALRSADVGQALLNRSKTLPIAHFTTHDLRRTVVSKMDELGISLDTIAATIGHQRGTAATRVLLRHYSRPVLDPQIEIALTAWDAYLTDIILGVGLPSNVRRLAR